MEIMQLLACYLFGMPIILFIIALVTARRVDRAEKEIAKLKATIDTMIKMGYQQESKEPPKPKYAAGGPMDSIRTGNEIF